jgi:predicted phage tail protein
MTLRTLHLYGDLAKKYGKNHRVAAGSLHEAVRIVECNHPGFLLRVRRGTFHCLHGDKTLKRSTEMMEHQVVLPRATGDFHLIPVAAGAKSRTGKIIFSIVVGGALLATGIGGAVAGGAFAAGGATTTAAFGASAFMGISYGTVALMGASIFLGGLSMLLTPAPKVNSENQKPTSFTFSGPVNAGDEGSAIPLVYGHIITGSVTIASDIRSGYGSMAYGSGGDGGGGGMNYGGGFGAYDYVVNN